MNARGSEFKGFVYKCPETLERKKYASQFFSKLLLFDDRLFKGGKAAKSVLVFCWVKKWRSSLFINITQGGPMQKTIMAVDDEKSVINSLNRVFRSSQYNFVGFDSPVKAIFALRKIKPHIIISDQCMPHIHGIDFLSRAKSISQRSLRILLTGFEIQKRKSNQDVDRFILKPWDNDELENVVINTIVHNDKIFIPVSPAVMEDDSIRCSLCGIIDISHEVRHNNLTAFVCTDCHSALM